MSLRHSFAAAIAVFALAAHAQKKPAPLPSKTVAETLGLERGETDLVAPTEKPTPAPAPIPTPSTTPTRAVSRPIISGPTRPKKAVAPAPTPTPVATPAPSLGADDRDEEEKISTGTRPVKADVQIERVEQVPPNYGIPPADTDTQHPSSGGVVRVHVRNEQTRFGDRVDGEPRFQLGLHYIGSRWKKVAPGIKNGSLGIEIGVLREFAAGFEGGITAEFIGVPSNSTDNEHIGGATLNFETRFFPWRDSSFKPFFDLGFALGAYRVWTVDSENANSVTFRKHGSGVLVGIQPGLGLRFELTDRLSADLRLGYHAYFDNPNYKVGGWTGGFALNLSR